MCGACALLHWPVVDKDDRTVGERARPAGQLSRLGEPIEILDVVLEVEGWRVRVVTFLDPAAQEFFLDWEKAAKDLVAALRSMAGRNPYDRALSDLVGELSTRSDAFRTWWAAHNVRYHQTGTKRLHHPVVGDLELSYEVTELAADAGLRMAIFTAEPRAARPARRGR